MDNLKKARGVWEILLVGNRTCWSAHFIGADDIEVYAASGKTPQKALKRLARVLEEENGNSGAIVIAPEALEKRDDHIKQEVKLATKEYKMATKKKPAKPAAKPAKKPASKPKKK